ncbi:hypothetical protein QUA07_28595 [Microcoleus sp. T3_A4]|uniref:hypothetical protein n=1 Tax=Microcoleus sp. T3_A4 TaxID=2818968 RepID=UPI002FD55F9F
MKQKGIKHGGKRLGAGRPHRWAGGKTKTIRVPAAYVDKILRVVQFMDCNEGQLPTDIAFHTEGEEFSIPGYDAIKEIPYPDYRLYNQRYRNSNW